MAGGHFEECHKILIIGQKMSNLKSAGDYPRIEEFRVKFKGIEKSIANALDSFDDLEIQFRSMDDRKYFFSLVSFMGNLASKLEHFMDDMMKNEKAKLRLEFPKEIDPDSLF